MNSYESASRLNLTDYERVNYITLFSIADVDRDCLIGFSDAAFLNTSRLPSQTLKQIWQLAATHKQVGKQQGYYIDFENFCIALRLISRAQLGKELSYELALSSTFIFPSPPTHLPPECCFPLASFEGYAPLLPPPPQEDQKWVMSIEDRTNFEQLFFKADEDGDGFVTGEQARLLFQNFGLSIPDLRKVWLLSDLTKDQKLSKEEYIIALFLIKMRKQGFELPDTLPNNLHPNQISQTWIIPEEGRLKSYETFKAIDGSKTGFISGDQARAFFGSSGLPNADLRTIWILSDVDGDGQLNREEFAVAVFLTNMKLSGYPLPTSLPPSLLPSNFAGAPPSDGSPAGAFSGNANILPSPPNSGGAPNLNFPGGFPPGLSSLPGGSFPGGMGVPPGMGSLSGLPPGMGSLSGLPPGMGSLSGLPPGMGSLTGLPPVGMAGMGSGTLPPGMGSGTLPPGMGSGTLPAGLVGAPTPAAGSIGLPAPPSALKKPASRGALFGGDDKFGATEVTTKREEMKKAETKKKIEDEKAKITQLEKEKQEITQKTERSKDIATQNEVSLEELVTKEKQLLKEKEDLAKQLKEIEEKNNKLFKALNDTESNVDQLTKEVVELKFEIDKMQVQTESYTEKISICKKQISSLKTERDSLKKTLEQKKQLKTEQESQLNDLNKEVGSLEAERSALTTEINAAGDSPVKTQSLVQRFEDISDKAHADTKRNSLRLSTRKMSQKGANQIDQEAAAPSKTALPSFGNTAAHSPKTPAKSTLPGTTAEDNKFTNPFDFGSPFDFNSPLSPAAEGLVDPFDFELGKLVYVKETVALDTFGGAPSSAATSTGSSGGTKSPFGGSPDPFGKGDPFGGSGGDPFSKGGDPFGKGSDPFSKGSDPFGNGSSNFQWGKSDFGASGDAFAKSDPFGKLDPFGKSDPFGSTTEKDSKDHKNPFGKSNPFGEDTFGK